MLGYDTAGLLAGAVHAAGGVPGRTARLIEALENANFIGPRGLVGMDPQTHQADVPIYLREVTRSGSAAANTVLAQLAPAALPVAGDREPAGLRSGWLNAYLSV